MPVQHANLLKSARVRACGFDARRSPIVALVLVTGWFFLPPGKLSGVPDASLAILDAGIEKSEDAPFVSAAYHFHPGDFLYFRFQAAGFAVQSDPAGEVKKISMLYEITPQDANGIPLTPALSEPIAAELNPEDKNWTPKRRASFLLPSFVAAGEFRLHVVLKDLIAKTETTRDFPFRMGGVQIVPSPTVTIENFHFFRNEDDQEPLEVPAYSPGDTVYARFDMAGYQFESGNKYRLAYGITVFRPDGKPFLKEPNAAELSSESFYPAQFVPGDINITTSRASTQRGQYVVVLSVRDLVSKHTCEIKNSFTIE